MSNFHLRFLLCFKVLVYLKFLSTNSIICVISGSVSFDYFFTLVLGHSFLFLYLASDFVFIVYWKLWVLQCCKWCIFLFLKSVDFCFVRELI